MLLKVTALLLFQLTAVLGRRVFRAPLAKNATCVVTANGNKQDDVPNILKAFEQCSNGGTVVFPTDQSYWIASRLNPIVKDVVVEWRGQWTMSDDLNYWRNNSYPIAFQNHHAGIVFTGDGIHIDGYGTGGIHGNGDAWYTAEAGKTQPGRPMPFVFWNVSDVTVKNFFVKQPPLWSVNIMNGTDMWFDNIYVNATATKAPHGSNWVQNTDGFDTMDAKNIHLNNLTYQGGDDCIAIKPRSYNITVDNVACHGGNGIAIGSLGQYLENSSVENVKVTNVKIIRYNEDMHNAAYIKTWMGGQVPQSSYESAGLPRGGGWGSVRNILLANFYVQGADSGPSITQDNGNNGSYSGTSLMDISNVTFANFTGYLNDKTTLASISCSKVHPCFNIYLENMNLTVSEDDDTPVKTGKCKYTAAGGVHGLSGCS